MGRTGTFIALDYLLDQAKAENKVDVMACVYNLRKQRLNIVQTSVSEFHFNTDYKFFIKWVQG